MHAFHSCCQKILCFYAVCMFYVFFFFVLHHILTCGDHCSQRSKHKEPNQRCFPFFLQLAKVNVEAQRVERELRDELANSISKAASDADRSRITELEKAEAELRVEVSRHV